MQLEKRVYADGTCKCGVGCQIMQLPVCVTWMAAILASLSLRCLLWMDSMVDSDSSSP